MRRVTKVSTPREMATGSVCEPALYVDESVPCVDVKDKFNQTIFDRKSLPGRGLPTHEVGPHTASPPTGA